MSAPSPAKPALVVVDHRLSVTRAQVADHESDARWLHEAVDGPKPKDLDEQSTTADDGFVYFDDWDNDDEDKLSTTSDDGKPSTMTMARRSLIGLLPLPGPSLGRLVEVPVPTSTFHNKRTTTTTTKKKTTTTKKKTETS